MINLRYHIVSITAVFLALGIGVALGSTFLDRATVGRIDANISDAQERIDATEEENRILTEQVAQAEARDFAQLAASGNILGGRLEDAPVLMVVAPGVDQANLDALTLILTNASADLRGSMLLTDELGFAEGVDEDLAESLEVEARTPEGERDEVHGMLVDALVAAGAPAEEPAEEPDPTTTTTTTAPPTTAPGDTAPPTTAAPTTTSTTTTTTAPADEEPVDDDAEVPAPDGETPAIVTALVDADLIDIAPGPGLTADDPVLETTGYRYVYVTQPGLAPIDDEVLLSLLPGEETDPPLPAVVVSPSVPQPVEGEEPPGPTAVEQVRDDEELARLYDTVDDIDTYLGLQSTVLVLDSLDAGAAGHYGQGEGATALMPAGS